MSADTVARALERADSLLLEGAGVESALARRSAGRTAPGDRELLRSRVAAIAAAQRADGSWPGEGGALGATARALLELSELEDALAGPAVDDAPWRTPLPPALPPGTVPAALAWLRGRRGGAGRYGAGCDPGRHELGLCHHFLAGFHAPPADGADADPDLLLADAALALRAALRWGDRDTGVALHLDGLRQVISVWAWPDLVRVPPARLAPGPAREAARAGRGERRRRRREEEAEALRSRVLRFSALPSARAAVAALAAVLQAPMSPDNVAAAAEGIACLVRRQRGDGTWHGVPLFEALDTLLFGVARGYHADEVDAVLVRSAELLALTQKAGGGWGPEDGARTARQPLVAWRVLRHVTPARGADTILEATPA